MSRVVFGGSWVVFPRRARVAYRSSYTPGYRYYALGLRIARSPVQRMNRCRE
jgi:formylglycine-generating enzyme required for sulfatase activity